VFKDQWKDAWTPSEEDRQGVAPPGAIYFFPREVAETEIHAYVDDHLAPLDRRRIEVYLTRHPQQAARARCYQRLNAELRELFRIRPGSPPLKLQHLASRLSRYLLVVAITRLALWGAVVLVGLAAIAGLAGSWSVP